MRFIKTTKTIATCGHCGHDRVNHTGKHTFQDDTVYYEFVCQKCGKVSIEEFYLDFKAIWIEKPKKPEEMELIYPFKHNPGE